jgi:AcrR family transcriptional regulator
VAIEPKQTRSADSMNRMLVAGEELFLIGGPDAIRLDAIIERAGTSIGSFYARFESMEGYLDVLHERALMRIGQSLAPIMARAAEQSTIERTLHVYVSGFLKVLRQERETINFFAVGGPQVPRTRERGAAFVLQTCSALAPLIEPFLARPESPDTQRRLDMMLRLLIAMAFQQVMFDQSEVSPLRLSDKELAESWAASLSSSLADVTQLNTTQ